MASRRIGERLCTAAIILSPLAIAAYWIWASPAQLQADWLSAQGVAAPLAGWKRALAAQVAILVALPLLAGIGHLRTVLRATREGAWFDDAMLVAVPGIGRALLGWGAASLLGQPAISLLLTCDAPVGHRMVSVGIDQASLIALLAGCFALAMAGAARAARAIADDQYFTV